MQRITSAIILLIISGGTWFTSRYFYDEINDSKLYFVLVMSLLFFLCCSLFPKGFLSLRQGMCSQWFGTGVSLIGLALSVHGLLQYANIIPSHTIFPISFRYTSVCTIKYHGR